MQHELPHSAEPLPTVPGRSIWGPLYVTAWIALASGAIAYLAALAYSPEALRISVSTGPGTQDLGELEKLIAEGRVEMASLSNSLENVKAEISAMKADLAEIATARLQSDASLAAPDAAGAAAPKRTAAAAEPVPAPGETASAATTAAAAPAVEDEIEAALKHLPAEGAAADAIADAEPAAVVQAKAAPKKRFGLEIAQATSPDALRVNWDLIAERHGALLQGLTAVAQAPREGEEGYRLVTGPFASPAAAKSACTKLAAAGIACKLAAYEGEAF